MCYNSCNGMHKRYVDSSLQEWYKVWDRDEGMEDDYYYSMTLKRMVRLETGKGMVRLESGKVCETLSVSKFGLEGTTCPRLVGAKIDCIRRGVELRSSQLGQRRYIGFV